MIYLTCPTCGYFMGSKIEEFERLKKIICDNNELSDEEKGVKIQKVIKDLKLRRYCCNMRIMTAKDLVQDILPVSND